MTDLRRPCLSRQNCLSLSGEALIELIRAVHEKDSPFRFRAEGFSMSPFLKEGDIITIAPLRQSPVRRGDIVAFIHPNTEKPVVHRVVRKEGASLKIRGDNALNGDGFIPASSILGKVTRVERKGRKIYLGLGVERYIIALLSERSLLTGLMFRLSNIRRAIRNAIKKRFL
jgi:signal peptidase I